MVPKLLFILCLIVIVSVLGLLVSTIVRQTYLEHHPYPNNPERGVNRYSGDEEGDVDPPPAYPATGDAVVTVQVVDSDESTLGKGLPSYAEAVGNPGVAQSAAS